MQKKLQNGAPDLQNEVLKAPATLPEASGATPWSLGAIRGGFLGCPGVTRGALGVSLGNPGGDFGPLFEVTGESWSGQGRNAEIAIPYNEFCCF